MATEASGVAVGDSAGLAVTAAFGLGSDAAEGPAATGSAAGLHPAAVVIVATTSSRTRARERRILDMPHLLHWPRIPIHDDAHDDRCPLPDRRRRCRTRVLACAKMGSL